LTARAGELLSQPRYRSSARRLAAVYQGIDGPGLAADAILARAAI
jgi:hypothetical protein